jgi:hypothetical protein
VPSGTGIELSIPVLIQASHAFELIIC